MITLNNYEEFLMLYIDGELAGDEREEFERFVGDHPEVGDELAQFQLVKMAPDMTVAFEPKEQLLKPETRVVPLISFGRLSAAAALLLTLTIGGVAVWQNKTEVAHQVAVTHSTPTATVPQAAPAQAVQPQVVESNTDVAAVQQPEAVTAKVTSTKPVARHKKNEPLQAVPINGYPTSTTVDLYAATTQQMQPLPVRNGHDSLVAATVPALNIVPEAEVKQSWLDKLPLDDLKRQQIDELGESLAMGVSKAGKIKNIRPEISFSVKLEKKKLILSF